MGCTPSKSVGTYTQDPVYGDPETASTVLPSLKSSVSTPEGPPRRSGADTRSGTHGFLNVPGRDVYGRPVSPGDWTALSVKPDVTDSVCDQGDLVLPPDPVPPDPGLPPDPSPARSRTH
ncbi:unnamed protein product [Merluccius merluccius]